MNTADVVTTRKDGTTAASSSSSSSTTTHTTITTKVVTLSDKELRQHTLLQQQKSGLPMNYNINHINNNDDQRSIDSSTGAAYHVPIGGGGGGGGGRRLSTTTPSVRSGRLSVISDVKADIYDCDVDSNEGNIGQTEEEEDDDNSPTSSSPHATMKRTKTTITPHASVTTTTNNNYNNNNNNNNKGKKNKFGSARYRKTKKQNRSTNDNNNSNSNNTSHTMMNEKDVFWTKPNVRLVLFIMILSMIVTVAIIVVVLLTKPSHNNNNDRLMNNSSMTGNTTMNDNNNDNNNNNNNNNSTTDGSPPPTPPPSLPPSQIYNNEVIQYIQQVLVDITQQTYNSGSSHHNNDNGNTENMTNVWDDPTSSQVLARNWIIYQDTFLLSINDTTSSTTSSSGDITTNTAWMDRLLQRYGLVQLYYATAGSQWVVNNNFTNTELVEFANPTTSECTWTGVYCDDRKRRRYLKLLRNIPTTNHHHSMEQYDYHLKQQQQQHRFATAILSHEFGDTDPIQMNRIMQADTDNFYGTDGAMNKIFRLYFQRMNLTGTIPNELGRCIPKLYELDLSQNRLYGTIPFALFTPDSLWDTSLLWLDFSSNKLRGSIPSNIWTLQELKFLFLNNNALTGHIERYLNETRLTTTTIMSNNETNNPDDGSSISNDTNGTMGVNDDDSITDIGGKRSNLLKQIQLYDNALSGSIPDWFQELSDLEQFIVFENQLTGPLPDPLPASLIIFDVSFNNISGTIPIKLWSESDSPTKIERMYLDHNQLSGTIPNSTQLRQDMQRLWLNDNYQLSGTIPENFGQAWSRLSELQLHHTNVTGRLGPTINNGMEGPECLVVWPNLTNLKANCFQRAVTDVPPVYCDCCTLCETVHGRKRRRQRRR